MISGCTLFDIVEAAHISPFRGDNDNHPDNGLLLRTDLHTLFDLDLIGIEPTKLRIHLHPSIVAHGYKEFEGSVLRCHSAGRPSEAALERRWSWFERRVASTEPSRAGVADG